MQPFVDTLVFSDGIFISVAIDDWKPNCLSIAALNAIADVVSDWLCTAPLVDVEPDALGH